MQSLRSWMVLSNVVCCIVTASAAMAPLLSLENLIDRSPVIVEGHVVRSWMAWDSSHRYIWTHYEIEVTDNIRGFGSTLTVSEPGGSMGGVNQGFSGSVGYSNNEHVILFLFRTPTGYWRTSGGAQGKFTISTEGRIRGGLGSGESGTRIGTGETARDIHSPYPSSMPTFKSLVRTMAHSRAANEAR
jgi:hypothetical protein